MTKNEYVEFLKQDFQAFCQLADDDYMPSWFHTSLINVLTKVQSGELKNVVIACPPRHGKTNKASRLFPAWCFLKNPNEKIILGSYSSSLATHFNRQLQRFMLSDRYVEVAGNLLNSKNVVATSQESYLRNSEIFEIVGHKGFFKTAGRGAGITGMGASLMILDDPLKDWQEASSPTIRKSAWDWFTSTFLTRLEKNARCIVIATRWHEDDITGRLIKEFGNDWTLVNYEAIKTTPPSEHDPRKIGEALWPEFYPIEVLNQKKKQLGSFVFESLYQQNPISDSSSIVKASWFKYYDVLPARMTEIKLSCDLTFKGGQNNDYVVMQVWGKHEGCFYLIDQIRAQMSFTETISQFELLCLRYPQATKKLVEDAANGAALHSHLSKRIHGIVLIKPTKDKATRLHAVSPVIEAGNVYVPRPQETNTIGHLIHEVSSFPSAANDDTVDAMTQALANYFVKSKSAFGVVGKSDF